MTDRYGVVVAGGRSTRFGDRDKAVADLAGTPMIRRVADRLRPAVDALVVNGRADQRDAILDALRGYPLDVTYAEDADPDEGPVAGLRDGLRAVADATGPETDAAVVACDMPFVERAVVDLLFDCADEHDAAVPKLDDGWYQPLQAVYRAAPTAAAAADAVARGDRKVLAPLDDLDWVVVEQEEVETVGSAGTFENLNTREAFDAAAERLQEGGSDA